MTDTAISRVITLLSTVPGAGPEAAGRYVVSIGLVTNDGIGWGDCLLPDSLAPVVVKSNLVERVAQAASALLNDQPVGAFRPLAERVQASKDAMLSVPGIRAGVEQALLAVAAASNREQPWQTLAREYELPQPAARPRLMAVIPDYAATPEQFGRVLAQSPEAIGYRLTGGDVAAVVGQGAAELTRFVGELSGLARSAAAKPQLIYLAVRGALGLLTADPRRQIDRVVDMVLDLETAAAPLELIIEDPVQAPDVTQGSALMRQLRERLAARNCRAKLCASGALASVEDVEFLAEVGAVDGVVVRPGEWGDLGGIVRAAAAVRRVGLSLYVATGQSGFSEACHVAEVALAVGADGLLLTAEAENAAYIHDLSLQLARAAAA